MTLSQFDKFVATAYTLAIHQRWNDLVEYFALVRVLLYRPEMIITPGQPKDKEH